MMNKEKILYEISDGITKYLEGYDIEKITITETVKNNGVKYTGICIKLRNIIFAPNLYVDKYLKEISEIGGFCNEEPDIDYISLKMAEDFKAVVSGLKDDVTDFFDSEEIENRLYLALVNYEMNKDTLEDCPYIMFNDLALTFRWLGFQRHDSMSSVLVHNMLQEKWGLATDEMFRVALKNTMDKFPVVIKKLDEVIYELTGTVSMFESPFYVMSNTKGINGATVLIYKNVLEGFSNKINSNLYIIPSSIHEVLLLPSDIDIRVEDIQEITRSVNESVVGREEILSDSIYYYDKEMKNITIISA